MVLFESGLIMIGGRILSTIIGDTSTKVVSVLETALQFQHTDVHNVFVELDLEVKPGTASTGYVSNVEGVIDRFMDVIIMVTRQAYVDDTSMQDIKKLQEMHTALLELKEDPIPRSLTIELLDPNGHSQIIHGDAVLRELSEDELSELPVGPESPVFDNDEFVE